MSQGCNLCEQLTVTNLMQGLQKSYTWSSSSEHTSMHYCYLMTHYSSMWLRGWPSQWSGHKNSIHYRAVKGLLTYLHSYSALLQTLSLRSHATYPTISETLLFVIYYVIWFICVCVLQTIIPCMSPSMRHTIKNPNLFYIWVELFACPNHSLPVTSPAFALAVSLPFPEKFAELRPVCTHLFQRQIKGSVQLDLPQHHIHWTCHSSVSTQVFVPNIFLNILFATCKRQSGCSLFTF